MTEEPKEKLFREIIDQEVDRPRFNVERSPTDRRIKDERRVMTVPKFQNIRDGMQLYKPDPIPHPYQRIVEIGMFLRDRMAEHPGLEIMVVMMLNAQNLNVGIKTVAIGTSSGVYVDPRDVFEIALQREYKARGIILAHNHPSGDSKPSPDDLEQMRHIKRIGDQIGCPLKDFIVLGAVDHCSLKNETYEL